MMYKNYIIRDKIYPEEIRKENQISQRVCVIVNYNYRPLDFYSYNNKEKPLEDKSTFNNMTISGYDYLLIYVRSEKLALELAKRWCNEQEQKLKNYKVCGIDKYYSVFD